MSSAQVSAHWIERDKKGAYTGHLSLYRYCPWARGRNLFIWLRGQMVL